MPGRAPMDKQEIEITFPDVSPDVANMLAESLAAELGREVKDEGRPVQPRVVRTDPTAQDFGATLVLVLGTPAVLILAKAIRDWAKRTDRGTISVNGATITNVNSRDVADIIKALNSTPRRPGRGTK